MQQRRNLLIRSRFIHGIAPDLATDETVIKNKNKRYIMYKRSLSVIWLFGCLVVSGGVRCGCAKAPVERYYSPTQPPPVTGLLCYVQCITGWAVGGGTQGHTHTHTSSETQSRLNLQFLPSLYLFQDFI